MGIFTHAKWAAQSLSLEATELVSNMGWNWIGRPEYAYSKEAKKYWIGTVIGDKQYIIQYDENTDTFTNTVVGEIALEKDDHNKPTILIRSSDKRLLIVYATHVDSHIRFRLSTNPLDGTSWGAEYTFQDGTLYSYPSIYENSVGEIFVYYRKRLEERNERWMIIKSTDGGATFGTPLMLINNGEHRPYIVTCQEGDILHFLMSSGHPQWDSPYIPINEMHFSYNLLTGKIYNSFGAELIAPVNEIKATTIKTVDPLDASWVVDITTKNGVPRVLYTIYKDYESDNFKFKELHFAELSGGQWVSKKVADVMNKHIENDATLESSSYMPAARFDLKSPDIIWAPIQVNGILEMFRVDISQTPIYFEQLTFDSAVDNWRPVNVPSQKNNLLWLRKDEYDHWLNDYNNTLMYRTVKT